MRLDTGEPFGLPRGTVRGLIALASTATVLWMFATGHPVPEALLGIATLIIGFYFGNRGAQPPAEPPIERPIGGDEPVE